MTTKLDIMNAIHAFVNDKIDALIGNDSLMQLAKPVVKKMANNYINNYDSQIDTFLSTITNKEGHIEFTDLFDDVLEEFNKMEPVTIENENLGDLKIGKGKVSMIVSIPFMKNNHEVTLTTGDFEEFKSYLSSAIANRNTMRY